jgi:hypothetical protein
LAASARNESVQVKGDKQQKSPLFENQGMAALSHGRAQKKKRAFNLVALAPS